MSNGEIAIVENQQPLTLIEQTDPAIIIEDATNIANQLADIIKQKKLYKRIGNKDHVYVEGWTTLGALIKVFPVLEYSRRLDREDELIYESRVIAQTLEGKVVGTGEALCSNKENNWRGRDEYAIKSMSQTRATSKALRIPLGWIMTLAGYSATPAEEMSEDMIRQPGKPARKPAKRRPASARKPATPKSSVPDDVDPENVQEAEVSSVVNGEARKWKQLSEKNPAVKKVCDSLNNAGLEIHNVNVNAECEDMLQKKKLTENEHNKVMVALGKAPG